MTDWLPGLAILLQPIPFQTEWVFESFVKACLDRWSLKNHVFVIGQIEGHVTMPYALLFFDSFKVSLDLSLCIALIDIGVQI